MASDYPRGATPSASRGRLRVSMHCVAQSLRIVYGYRNPLVGTFAITRAGAPTAGGMTVFGTGEASPGTVPVPGLVRVCDECRVARLAGRNARVEPAQQPTTRPPLRGPHGGRVACEALVSV
jgi:hypothetical protein